MLQRRQSRRTSCGQELPEGIIDSIELNIRDCFGLTKKIKHEQSLSVNGRVTTVSHGYDCPVFIDDMIYAFENTPNVSALKFPILMYPLHFDETCLRNRQASVKKLKIHQKQFRFNFAMIDSSLSANSGAAEIC